MWTKACSTSASDTFTPLRMALSTFIRVSRRRISSSKLPLL
jgi:hypothetical protein